MNALEQLLWSLEQPDLDEIVIASGSFPKGVRAGDSTSLTREAWDTDSLLSALVAFGGSRHVEELSSTPRQWTARVNGLGVISVSATQARQNVEARFRLMRKPGKSNPPPEPKPSSPSGESVFPVLTSPPPFESARPPVSPQPRGRSQSNFPPAPPGSAPRALRPPSERPPSSRAGRSEDAPPASPQGPSLRLDTPTRVHGAGQQSHLTPPLFEALHEGPGIELDLSPPKPLGPPPLPPKRPSAMAIPALDVLPPLQPLVARTPNGPSRPASIPDLPPPPRAASAPAVMPPLPPPPAPAPSRQVAPAMTHSLDGLMSQARAAKASDLHIIAGRPPLFRIAGELRSNGGVISPDQVERIVLPTVPDRLVNVLLDQGSCDFALFDRAHGRFRVNVSKQQTGYKACLRLISKEMPTLESLRLPDGIAHGAHHHQGLIVFTGPTGHGKTTTMNAVVDFINRTTSHHIITVEDPVEHLHVKKKALMSQREVGTHTASFATALKGSLREDPDVIVVGELRDVETVRMAVAASETGHLVLGTMNTPSAARTIDRLVDLFPPGDQPQIRLTLAGGLRLIVSQRLVPGKDGASMHAAFEVLPGSMPLSALIRDNKTFQIPSLQQRGKALGIVRLDESLAVLVSEGRVTIDSAKLVCEAPAELDAILKTLRGPGR